MHQPENPSDAAKASRALAIMAVAHVLGALASSVQRLVVHAQINNFLIFRGSFWHLMHGQDLYAAYPAEHFDVYKYSPTFALLFAPFAVVPVGIGLTAWNVLNAAALCAVVAWLLPPRAAAWTLGVVFLEALGSAQNAQSNGLVTALMIVALVATERRRTATGALSVAIGTSIKLFPLGAGLFGLMDVRRWRHLAWCLLCGAALLAAPLLVTSMDTLLGQYRSWSVVESRDHAHPGMMWIGGALEWMAGGALPHAPIQVVGVLWMLLTAALALPRWSDATTRRLLLASMLGFATVFNHQAESPSYVIAFTGLGIWWSVLPRERWRDVVLAGAFVFGSLSGTDLAPGAWRQVYYFKWQLKAIVVTLAWCAMQRDVWRALRPSRTSPNGSGASAAVT